MRRGIGEAVHEAGGAWVVAVKFYLKGGESAEVFVPEAGTPIGTIYRFVVERFDGAALKILRDRGEAKVIDPHSRTCTLDVATSTAMFIEAMGEGSVAGWYDVVG